MRQQPEEEVGLDVAVLAPHPRTFELRAAPSSYRRPPSARAATGATQTLSSGDGKAQSADGTPLATLRAGGARTRGGGSKLAVSGRRPFFGSLALQPDMHDALGRDHGVMAAKPTRAHTSSSQLRAGVEDRFWSLSSRDFQTEALDKKLIDTRRALRR